MDNTVIREGAGKRLRLIRKGLRYTQERFASMLEITQSRLNSFEQGNRMILPEIALRFREATGYTADWLYSGDESGLPTRLSSNLKRFREADPAAADITARHSIGVPTQSATLSTPENGHERAPAAGFEHEALSRAVFESTITLSRALAAMRDTADLRLAIAGVKDSDLEEFALTLRQLLDTIERASPKRAK